MGFRGLEGEGPQSEPNVSLHPPSFPSRHAHQGHEQDAEEQHGHGIGARFSPNPFWRPPKDRQARRQPDHWRRTKWMEMAVFVLAMMAEALYTMINPTHTSTVASRNRGKSGASCFCVNRPISRPFEVFKTDNDTFTSGTTEPRSTKATTRISFSRPNRHDPVKSPRRPQNRQAFGSNWGTVSFCLALPRGPVVPVVRSSFPGPLSSDCPRSDSKPVSVESVERRWRCVGLESERGNPFRVSCLSPSRFGFHQRLHLVLNWRPRSW